MAIDRWYITHNGRAAFYACVWPELTEAANSVGWALGLHGSLKSDMDIMAMPWTESAKSLSELADSLRTIFTDAGNKDFGIDKIGYKIDMKSKPNGRIVLTISIWADFYLDINIIKNEALIINP